MSIVSARAATGNSAQPEMQVKKKSFGKLRMGSPAVACNIPHSALPADNFACASDAVGSSRPVIEPARDLMPATGISQRRAFRLAAIHHIAATGMKCAAGGRVDRARHVAVD